MKMKWIFSAALFSLGAAAAPALGATLQVGPGKTYAKPCLAIAAAMAGDIIEVDAAGSYQGDTCAWSTDNLTVRGVNGRAKIDITGTSPAQKKGLFTIAADNATIENLELMGAAISQADGNNGAGIRHQGTNLTVRGCYFHDNQDGILGAPATPNTGTVLIENSEFANNGAGDGFSHNMYINNYAKFTLQYSYSHGSKVGHLVKSRAYTSIIQYNRLTDEVGGTGSYEVDLPNGGTAYVIGNLIEQSATSQNPSIIAFAEESVPTGYDDHLFVINNTILNNKGSGTFVVDTATSPAVLTNNIFWNGGTISGQTGAVLSNNFDSSMGDPKFTDVTNFDVHLLTGSPCIDQGKAPGNTQAQPLGPTMEYVHPVKETGRGVAGAAIDIGAYEYQNPGTSTSDGGTSTSDGGTAAGDGGTSGGAMASGCGCVVGGAAGGSLPSSAAGGLMGILAMVLRRRKR